jgi:hypothetical protein
VVSVTDPYGRIFDFLDRSRYFFLSSSSSVVLMRLSEPRSRPTTFFSGSAWNRTRAPGSVAKNSDNLTTEAVVNYTIGLFKIVEYVEFLAERARYF